MRRAKPKLLDLFCGGGGASEGYKKAGFDVVGVDIEAQRRYPFEFFQADALKFSLRGFDVFHASPPCQAYTKSQRIMKYDHPELIEQIREILITSGKPYCIENVEGAPLINPITLCGNMFLGLMVYRHRLFESNVSLRQPTHHPHLEPQAKMGRPVRDGERIQVVGNFSGVRFARRAMGIDWMSRNELSEAIPPAYTHLVGNQLMQAIS